MENNELKRLYTLYYLKEDKPLTFCQWKETIGNKIAEYDRKCVQCECCGKNFIPVSYNQKFCSVKCREKKNKHTYYYAHREEILAKKAIKRKENRSNKKCVVCGKPLPRYQHKYCSSECQYNLKGYRQQSYSLNHIGDTKICAYCGKEFIFKGTNHKYCSKDCLVEVNRERAREYARAHRKEYVRTPKKERTRTRRVYERYEPNRCQYCGGVLVGDKFVICSECAKVSSLKYEPKVIYTGEVTDRLFPIGG